MNLDIRRSGISLYVIPLFMSHWKGKQNEKSMLITISSLCIIASLNPIMLMERMPLLHSVAPDRLSDDISFCLLQA